MLKLKELRTNAGLTQEELANACGVQRSTISMIEIGENKPSYDLILKLTNALKCTVDELVKGDE